MLPQCRTPGDVYTLPHFDVSANEVEGFLDKQGREDRIYAQ